MALKPGKKKSIKLSAAKLASVKRFQEKLEDLQDDLRSLKGIKQTKANAELLKKATEAVKKKIEKVKEKIASVTASNDTIANEKHGTIIKTLQKECSDAINVYKKTNAVLFRGVRGAPAAYVGKPRADRKPKDSMRMGQELFDYCLQKLGFTALRSNSIFATYDDDRAGVYGPKYIIFPKNGFAFTVTNRHDLVIRDSEIATMLDYTKLNKLNDAVEKFIVKSGWDYAPNINDYLDDPEEYFEILKDIGVPGVDKLNIYGFISPKAFKKEFEPQKSNFAAAVKSGDEVLISGEYIAIKENIARHLLPMLGIKLDSLW